jgi:hypothetical protein
MKAIRKKGEFVLPGFGKAGKAEKERPYGNQPEDAREDQDFGQNRRHSGSTEVVSDTERYQGCV